MQTVLRGMMALSIILLVACSPTRRAASSGSVECQSGESLTCTCPGGASGARLCVDGKLSSECSGCPELADVVSSSDADPNPDAGAVSDTGASADGGAVPDTGAATDTGVETDGGAVPDTGAATDTGCTPSCDGKECGDDGCGGACGTCPAAAPVCSDNVCTVGCAPVCAGKSCGGDGCGGSCGLCNDGQVCNEGACECAPACEGKLCGDDGCGGICGTCGPEEVCTDGACACAPNCDGKACGDDGCGGICGLCNAGQTCALGQCECVPQCDGKQCGDNGCGGACGTCGVGSACNAGQCECAPSCEGKQCGGDGCGGTCGDCSGGASCSAVGKCVGGACEPDCAVSNCGDDGCGGTCGTCSGADSCVSGICAPLSGIQALPLLRVVFHGAVVGPAKANGTAWDGPGTVSTAAMQQLAAALLGDAPDADVLALLAGGLFGGLEKPDPYADVEQAPSGTYDPQLAGVLVTADDNTENTFTPSWPGLPGYNGVVWDPQLSFRVTLYDEDLLDDDPMGTAEIHAGHIAAAYAAGGIYQVPVFDQTDNQILFLSIDVACGPLCSGKSCGDDGCGGVCGTCPAPTSCDAGTCTSASCGAVSAAGCCVSDALYFCDGGILQAIDCASNPSCGWAADKSWYDCGTDGGSDPSGTEPGTCGF